jgi:hypothetical protein
VIRLPDYPKPIAEYKPEAQLLLGKPCYVQEKFDGSQFTFAFLEGQYYARSRGQQIDLENPNELFRPAIEYTRELCEGGKLPAGLIFRGEAICRPKHNSLKYDRIPTGGFILFDVQEAITGSFWNPWGFTTISGLEYAPLVAGTVEEPLVFLTRSAMVDWASEYAQRQSLLGGAIEGYVFKEYNSSPDRAVVKVVRDEFKELHRGNEEYLKVGPRNGLDKVLAKLAGPARYTKALSHLRERGEYENSMRDMPKLMQELNADLDSDNAEIRELLWEVFGKEIKRQLGGGLALWYKDQLRAQ